MARDDAPPFGRGETFVNGAYTIDSNNLPGLNLEGQEYEFEDLDYASTASGAKPARTERRVRTRIVRNVGAAALLPKRVVRFQETAGVYGHRVDGYTRLTAEDFAGVVDEFLPSTGVVVNDLFHLVIKGPTIVLTDLAGGANNVHNVGDAVVALTGATSGATTAGRVAPQDLTGATAVLGEQIQNAIGRALSAKTTANTNADLLIDLFRKW